MTAVCYKNHISFPERHTVSVARVLKILTAVKQFFKQVQVSVNLMEIICVLTEFLKQKRLPI